MKKKNYLEQEDNRWQEDEDAENIELVECSNCHRQMEEDDLAYKADEDFSTLDISVDEREVLNQFDSLCFPCFRKILGRKND
jgi:hypothetical protein